MSSSSSRPLPHLPLETQGHVLRFCDQATLAMTSRVCLAWLELSIPILHERIHIEGHKKFKKLLCSRNGYAPSSVDAVLSLGHIKTFTLVRTDDTDVLEGISHHRISNGRYLVVSCLLLEARCFDFSDPWKHLLPLFDPYTVRFKCNDPDIHSFPCVNLTQVPWFRLRTIEFEACANEDPLGQAELVRRHFRDGDAAPLTVIYNLVEGDDLWEEDIGDIEEVKPGRDMFGPASRLAEVVVRVGPGRAMEGARETLMRYLERLSDAERERRLAKIRFEVVEDDKPT